jgi:hypothetical protein
MFNKINLMNKVHNIKIFFCNFQNDYNFSNYQELDKIIKDIDKINKTSIYCPIINIIGEKYFLNFYLETDKDYQKMKKELKQIYFN